MVPMDGIKVPFGATCCRRLERINGSMIPKGIIANQQEGDLPNLTRLWIYPNVIIKKHFGGNERELSQMRVSHSARPGAIILES